MPKQRTAFTVTVTTDGPVVNKNLASHIRFMLNNSRVLMKAARITKVTITPIGEK